MAVGRLSQLEFLKRYAPVDDDFVEDFFGMANPDAPNEPSISVDVAAKWLGVSKYHIIRQLKASHAKDLDYTMEKPQQLRGAGRGDNARKVVMVTPACFKLICMESRSARGVQVREYYVAVESTLFKYRAEITEGLQRRIKELEANQRPRMRAAGARRGVMYVISASDTDTTLNKLGRSRDLSRRLASHESARADGLHIRYTAVVEDLEQVESCVKALLKPMQYRKYKEVYRVSVAGIKRAIARCDELGIDTRRAILPRGATAAMMKGGGTVHNYIVFARGDDGRRSAPA